MLAANPHVITTTTELIVTLGVAFVMGVLTGIIIMRNRGG